MSIAALTAAAGIAGAAGNIASSVTDFGQTRRAQNRNYKLNERAAENAYARQIEQWNRQNEYNLPSNAYRRELQGLRENELSPGLLYSGAGSSSAPATDTSAPAGSGASGTGAMSRPPLSFSEAFQTAQSIKESQSRIESNKAMSNKANAEAGLVPTQNALIQSQTNLNNVAALSTEAQTTGQLLSNELAEATLPINIQQARLNLKTTETLLEQYAEQVKQSIINTRFASRTFDIRVAAAHQDIALKTAQTVLTYAHAEAANRGLALTDAQIAAQLSTNEALPSLLREQLGVLVGTQQVQGSQYQLNNALSGSAAARRRKTEKEINWFDANEVQGVIRTATSFLKF